MPEQNDFQRSIFAVVLAGGFGKRLWPESREKRPKPFLKLWDAEPLFSQTIRRLKAFLPIERIFVSTGSEMKSLVLEAFPDAKLENVLIEPCSKNTAPAIGLAAIRLLNRDPNATMIVLPSDHAIEPTDAFVRSILFAAEEVARAPERLITLGIRPTFPATAYGYIETSRTIASDDESPSSDVLDNGDVLKLRPVESFHEKPTTEKATEYLKTKRFYWNSGVFVWKAKTIFNLIDRFEPEIGRRLRSIQSEISRFSDRSESAVVESEFSRMKNVSIDYAVLEKASNVFVLPATFHWNDLGTFDSLDHVCSNRDDEGNSVFGARLVAYDSSGNRVRVQNPTDSRKLVALLGVQNITIVQTPDVTLVVPKNRENEIQALLDLCRENKLDAFL